MLRGSLFGGFSLTWNEQPLPALPGATARSLLAYLLTYRRQPHTRDLLAGIFWPDIADIAARRRLSQTLWQIGRFWRNLPTVQANPAAPPLLLASADTLHLHPDLPLWLDVEEFARQHTLCLQHSPESPESLQAAARCRELYRGEFLAGYYDDWVMPEREGLRAKLLQVLERQLQGYKSRGEYERALACARRLVAEDPWREEAHREVMRLCHLLSRDDEALRQYESCRQTLVSELDTPPSPATAALAEEIAARAGLAAPVMLPARSRPPEAPRLERPDQLPLTGRRAELAELLGCLESAARGHGGLVLLYGEAGVGKSRLLRELAANAQWRGIRTAWGRCYQLAAPPAYQPLIEVLRAHLPALTDAPLSPLWRRELARLLPELAAGPPLPLPARQGEAGRLLEAIARAFAALAATSPLLLLLEDAQWMDSASLEALRYLLPRLADMPLLVVVSVRGEELAGEPATVLAAMERTHLTRRLDLGRLDAEATAELVQRALDLPRPAPRFSARLYAETEGNPFFLVETLLALVQEGMLVRDEAGGWSTPWDRSTDDYAELPLPASVVQSIAQRLARLPPATLELLQLAAVIGRKVDFSLWLGASGCLEEELLAVGDELCARGLFLAAAGIKATMAGPPVSPAADYTFAHDLIRRVAYERLPAPRRRTYHRRVAEALRRLAPDQSAILAYHWTQAEVWDQAAGAHHRAGDQARAVYAHAAAATHYTQALEAMAHLPGPPDREERYRLLLARETVYGLLGDRPTQHQDLVSLQALAAALGDGDRQAEVALRRAAYANATGDYAGAIAAAREAIGLAHPLGDQGREALACLHWGKALWHQGDWEEACTRLQHTLDLARDARLPSVVADGHLQLGQVFLAQGNYAEAGDHFTRASELYREAGDARGQGAALENLGRLYRLQGDYRGAQSCFEQALGIFSQVGDRQGECRAWQCLGSVAINRGDHDEAESCLERALRIADEIGDREAQGNLLGSLGVLDNRRCRYGQAHARFEQALDICREIGNRHGQVVALTNLGIILYCQGDDERAMACAEQSLQLCREIGDRRYEGWALHTLGRAGVRLGGYALAQSRYEQALAIGRDLRDRQLEAAVLLGLSRLAHEAGDDRLARDYARQSLGITQEIGELVDVAYAQTALAWVLAAQGELDEAGTLFRQAVDLRRRLGQHNLAMESQAGLAEIALARGDLAGALACVEEILAHTESGTLDGTDEPLRIMLTCYRVLETVHDTRAPRALIAAHGLLQEQAARIGRTEMRRYFLEEVPLHKQIIAAYQALSVGGETAVGGRRITVFLPRADVPRGRLLRADDFIRITWTLDLPDGARGRHKVARRRQRILRLLAEAQAQRAVPRDEDLAAALDVSLPTLRRDMAALRARGHHLCTRGRR